MVVPKRSRTCKLFLFVKNACYFPYAHNFWSLRNLFSSNVQLFARYTPETLFVVTILSPNSDTKLNLSNKEKIAYLLKAFFIQILIKMLKKLVIVCSASRKFETSVQRAIKSAFVFQFVCLGIVCVFLGVVFS